MTNASFEKQTWQEDQQLADQAPKPTAAQLGLDPAAAIRALRDKSNKGLDHPTVTEGPTALDYKTLVDNTFGNSNVGSALKAHHTFLQEVAPHMDESNYAHSLSAMTTRLFGIMQRAGTLNSAKHKGEWERGTRYSAGDTVIFDNIEYLCIKETLDTKLQKPSTWEPAGNERYWQFLRHTKKTKELLGPKLTLRGTWSAKDKYFQADIVEFVGDHYFFHKETAEPISTSYPSKDKKNWQPWDKTLTPFLLKYLNYNEIKQQIFSIEPSDDLQKNNDDHDGPGTPGWSSEAVPTSGLLELTDPRCAICGALAEGVRTYKLPVHFHMQEPDFTFVTKTHVAPHTIRLCTPCQATVADFIISLTHPHLSN